MLVNTSILEYFLLKQYVDREIEQRNGRGFAEADTDFETQDFPPPRPSPRQTLAFRCLQLGSLLSNKDLIAKHWNAAMFVTNGYPAKSNNSQAEVCYTRIYFVVRDFLGIDLSPTAVLEVHADHYVSRPIIVKDDGMTLFGPNEESKNSREKCYEIVLKHDGDTFSLFRSNGNEAAESQFNCFKDKVVLYSNITQEWSLASLQRLCDILTANPTWSVAHFAAHFGVVNIYHNATVQAHLNEAETEKGMTPIMVAVKAGNLRTIQSLVAMKCSLTQVDFDENSVLHHAASSSKEIITALFADDSCKSILNGYNSKGYTPYHVACLADKSDCVKALLLAGADVNLPSSPTPEEKSSPSTPGNVGELLQDISDKSYWEDMKKGGTPLHWSTARRVIDALIDKHCNVDILNFDRRTALHVMVLRNRMDCVIALLSRGANPSISDFEGNTPLHLAAKGNNISLVQALIGFGADINYKNMVGETPRHLVPLEGTNNADKILYILHAVGAERCDEDMKSCRSSCAANGVYDGVAPPPVLSRASREKLDNILSVGANKNVVKNGDTKSGRLLCLDGGGIRGLVLVRILMEIEEVLGQPIVEAFDWVAGTSTGGILALALACGKSLKECQCIYFTMKEQAFAGIRPYPSEPLEAILKEGLGPDTKMGDIEHPKLMIMGALADRKPIDLYMFRNYESPDEILQELSNESDKDTSGAETEAAPPRQLEAWAAARASGAAPTYFRAFGGRFLDGGLVANNPTLDALTELTELKLACQAAGRQTEADAAVPTVVVSCGTGLVPLTKLADIDVFRPENLWDTARLAKGLSAIGALMVDQATRSEGRVVDRARAWCCSTGVPYYRFCPQMSSDIAMDERSDDILVGMIWETAAYMHSNRDQVIQLAELLRQSD